MKRTKPPKFAERILGILSSSKKIGILGDTEEGIPYDSFGKRSIQSAYMVYLADFSAPPVFYAIDCLLEL